MISLAQISEILPNAIKALMEWYSQKKKIEHEERERKRDHYETLCRFYPSKREQLLISTREISSLSDMLYNDIFHLPANQDAMLGEILGICKSRYRPYVLSESRESVYFRFIHPFYCSGNEDELQKIYGDQIIPLLQALKNTMSDEVIHNARDTISRKLRYTMDQMAPHKEAAKRTALEMKSQAMKNLHIGNLCYFADTTIDFAEYIYCNHMDEIGKRGLNVSTFDIFCSFIGLMLELNLYYIAQEKEAAIYKKFEEIGRGIALKW